MLTASPRSRASRPSSQPRPIWAITPATSRAMPTMSGRSTSCMTPRSRPACACAGPMPGWIAPTSPASRPAVKPAPSPRALRPNWASWPIPSRCRKSVPGPRERRSEAPRRNKEKRAPFAAPFLFLLSGCLLRCREAEFRCLIEMLARLQFGRREGRDIGRIGEMLRLQAEGAALDILRPAFAHHRLLIVGQVKLDAGLGGPYIHHPAAFRLQHMGGGPELAHRPAHDEVD